MNHHFSRFWGNFPLHALLLIGAFLSLGTEPLGAQLRLEPAPYLADFGVEAGDLSGDELLELSLRLSGTPEAQIPGYQEQLDQLTAQFGESSPHEDEAPLGDLVLQFLHKNLFKRYAENQTRLDVVFDRGVYNCVSSSLVYMILMNRLGVRPLGVATRDHAFSLVPYEGRMVDVETTSLWGWEPGTKKEFHDSFGNTTGFSYVPQGNYKNRRIIDERGFLGLMIQNFMAEAQIRGRNAEALALAVDRAFLESSPESKQALTQAFQNHISDLNRAKKYPEALDLAQIMLERTGPSPELQQLAGALVNNQALVLFDKSQYPEAVALVREWEEKELLTGAFVATLLENGRLHELYQLMNREIRDDILNYIDLSQSQGILRPAKAQEVRLIYHGKKAQSLSQNVSILAALDYLKSLPAQVRGQGNLKKAEEVFSYNYSVEIHNRFALFYNQKKFEEAERVLHEGLAVLPGSKLLLDAQKRYDSLKL